MKLPESILWTMDQINSEDLLGIYILCEESKRKEIAISFNENMDRYWREAKEEVEKEYGWYNSDNNYSPAIAGGFSREKGVFVRFYSIPIFYAPDEQSDMVAENANAAIEKTLVKLLREYPEISVEGYIGYCFRFENGGEAYQYELTSKGTEISYGETDRVYDFVGETISRAMEDYHFWDGLIENVSGIWRCTEDEETKNVFDFIHAYAKWLPEDAYEGVLTFASKEIRPELEEKLKKWENGEKVLLEG